MNTNTSARDTFLYLMAIISLAASAISLGALLFQVVNNYFPDASRYYSYGLDGSIRYAIAVLIVMFPVFLGVSSYIKKDLIASPEKADMRVRRWLLYLTVFVASLVIIGDLIGVIFSFLDGELTIRFILKALIILAISSGVFSYYLRELRWEMGMVKTAPVFFWASLVGVLLSIILGFVVIGSPASQRAEKFDAQKISDLQAIQYSVEDWYRRNSDLPKSLMELKAASVVTRSLNIVDPETGVGYDYSILNKADLSYSLCATFNKDMPQNYNRGGYWEYNMGQTCFTLIADENFKALPLY